MICVPYKSLAIAAIIAGLGIQQAAAKDRVVLTIPLHSRMSPVQKLNREGVELVKKNKYEKAEALFLKAYLYDPSDPFTLNNLGYVAELQGQLERAEKYYQLATEQGCNAPIDMSSMKQLKGKPMLAAFSVIEDLPMRINRMNIDAMDLLAQGRSFEAAALLEQALALDPRNPFTENNLGAADEAIGDYEGALGHYTAAAAARDSQHVTVTEDRAWRGKSISSMAEASAKRLKKRLETMQPDEVEALKLEMRGVYEENQNQWSAARQDFLHAFSLDPNSAFSLNDRAYVAEREGDLETAQFYYSKAWKAGDADARIGLATQSAAQGRKLLTVATESSGKVDRALDIYGEERRQQQGPVQLTPRGAEAQPSAPAPGSNSTTSQPSSTPNLQER